MNRAACFCTSAFLIAVAVAAGAPACGGTTASSGSPGSGAVTGTVGGVSLNVADAVVIAERGTIGVDATAIVVEIFDIANVCALAQSFPKNAKKASYTALVLGVGAAMPVGPGTYGVGQASFGDGGTALHGSATLVKSDAQCNQVIPGIDGIATSGTITISAISSATVSGSFDLVFKTGSMKGSFGAATCALPDAGASSTDGGPSCL